MDILTWNYRVKSSVNFDFYMKWYTVNVTVESDNGQQNFAFIYHDKPEEKTIKVCMNRALRAFCLHQLDELNNPFDKNNVKSFGYTSVKVTQKDEEESEITIPLGALLKEDVERIKKILHNRLNAFDAERQRVDVTINERVAYGIFPKDITEATVLTERMYQIEKYSESLKESILNCNKVTYSAKKENA